MPTFPYTPGFIHGEAFTYAVQVNQFRDLSEQRYLLSRQRGVRLTYEFTRPDSSLIAGITSFYLGQGGPRDTFTAVDHRDGSSHTVRFAAPTLEHFIGPHLFRRALRVEFIREEGGTTLTPTAYVPPTIPEFCDPVVPTSGVVSPSATSQRDGWVFANGPITITPTARFLPLGSGAPTSAWCDAEGAMPSGVTLTALTLRVITGGGGTITLDVLVNSTAQAGLTLTAGNTSFSTTVATGTLVTSRGQLICLRATCTNNAVIAYAVGYTHAY